MKKIIFIFFILVSINIFSSIDKLNTEDFKIILSSQNMKDKKDEKIDINYATKVEMLGRGVASSYADKIIAYRDLTGSFEKLDELKRIKGIREATYLKLTKIFKIERIPKKNNLYINSVNDEILKYYGFDKKEVKKIRKYIEKNGKIFDSIELKKIITKSKYEKLKDKIRYEEKKY